MSPHIEIESLEDLAANRAVANSAIVAAHLAGCDECREELAWIRSERALFDARAAKSDGVEALWDGVASQLAQPAQSAAPYRAPAVAPSIGRATSARRYPWVAAAAMLAAGAVAAVAWVRVDRARWAPAQSAEMRVQGAVTVRVRAASSDVRIEPGASDRVRAALEDRRALPRLVPIDAQTIELRWDGPTPRGVVRVEVPRGAGLDVTTSSGDVTIGAVGGATRILTSSGDVRAAELGATDITSTSGDVHVRSIIGSIAIRTSSGDVEIDRSRDAQRVLATSTSGAVQWSGRCALGCAMQVRSNSGDVRLAFDSASSLTLRFETSSGSFRDGTHGRPPLQMPSFLWQMGAGVGAVQVETTSGSLAIDRAE